MDRHGRVSIEKTIWPQSTLASIAAHIARLGLSVDILDCIAVEMDWDAFEAELRRRRPRYVIFNCVSSTYHNDMRVARIAKPLGMTTIVGGTHVSAEARGTLEEYGELDIAVLNEFEESIGEAVRHLEERKPLDGVAGIAFRDGDRVQVNERRPSPRTLDNLPIPLHQQLPLEKYNLPFIGKRYTFVISSRGCPYRCIYCRSPVQWQRKVLHRPPEAVLEELKYCRSAGIRNFMFHSDIFTLNREQAHAICDQMIRHRLNMRWVANSRSDMVDRDILKHMREAGCWMITYGFESGSQRVLDGMKKDLKVEQSVDAAKWTKEAGIKVWGYFIFGLPNENADSVQETIDLSKRMKLDLVNFAVGAPYPGTEFLQMAKANEWLVSSDWSDFDQNYSAIVSYPDFSNDQIISAMKRAYKEWYFRPSSVWKLARGVRSWNDVRVLWATGTAHLKWIRSTGPLFDLGAKNRRAIEGTGGPERPKTSLPVAR
jgi:radical SAM superfamily enzyme YgiQ (UPF0313 family)